MEIVTAQQAFEAVGDVLDTESTVIHGQGRLYAPDFAAASLGMVGPLSPAATVTPESYAAGRIIYKTVFSASNTTWPLTGRGKIITSRLNTSSETCTYQWFISSTGATRFRRGATPTTQGAWQGPTHNNLVGLATATDDPITAFTEGTSLPQVFLTGSTAPGNTSGLLITAQGARNLLRLLGAGVPRGGRRPVLPAHGGVSDHVDGVEDRHRNSVAI